MIQQLANTDKLTQLYNRLKIDTVFDTEITRAIRYKTNFSVILLDIDFFKKVNDTYGHEAGDIVLKGFAQVFKEIARNIDIIGRYGGEEFLAILSETDRKGAVTFAEKVRKKLEISRFVYQGKKIQVTISGGIAYREEYPSENLMMKAADERLYKAKDSGRNQIVSS